ncbi:hypothetical protein [Methanoregula sp. UBA64]|uniref:hypothetical protein n=1 Tax=Methanoregula sp. UBA64 TaxID=1915554 RepID=UPI0025DD0F19|nr:hypothetical protein [Methanoregula sp. UBA64]
MKRQTLVMGSIIAVLVIAVIIGVGMVSGNSVFKPFISVDPVSDKNTGDVFTITGKTSLPEGTELLIEAYPASFKDQTGTRSGVFSGATGTVTVSRGSGIVNTWSWPLDTSKLTIGEYLVSVSSVAGDLSKGDFAKGDLSASATFTLHAASATGSAGPSATVSTEAKTGIVIDPIPDTTAGTPLTVTGKTSLPVGTKFSVKVIPASTNIAAIARNLQNPESAASTTVVKGDGINNRFSATLDTKNLTPDEHILVVSPAEDYGSGAGSGDSGWTGTALFNILYGTGSTQSQGTNSAGYIAVDPIPGKTTGDLLIVSGTTDLAAGTSLMVSVGNFGSNAVVTAGTGGINRYSMPVDTSSFKPGTLTVNVTEMIGDPAKGNDVPGPVHGLTTFVLGGSFLGSDTPVQVTPAASDFITVNKIGDRSIGDQFLITGTTSLPVGTSLLWQVMPDTGTAPIGVNKTAMGLAGGNMVTKGSGTTNRVSFAADMNQMPAGKWVVLMGVMKDGEFGVENPIATAYFTLS